MRWGTAAFVLGEWSHITEEVRLNVAKGKDPQKHKLGRGISIVCTPGKLAFQSLNLSACKVGPAILENGELGFVVEPPWTSCCLLSICMELLPFPHSQPRKQVQRGQVSLARVL